MAIFGDKKENKKEEKKSTKKVVSKKDKKEDKKPVTKEAVKKVVKETVSTGAHDLSWVLRKTRITEKSAVSAESKVYVFEVDPRANKKDVARAITEAYKVTPVKVNIAKVPSKKVTRRKRTGTTSGVKSGKKKAYVFLNKKDNIEFV